MKLPSFSFKKYKQTKEIEIENKHHLLETIVKIATDSRRGLNNDTVSLLVFQILGDSGDYELRIWMDKDYCYILSNLPGNIDNVYRLIIEEFEVTSIVAYYDIERSINLGYRVIKIMKNNIDLFRKTIANLIGFSEDGKASDQIKHHKETIMAASTLLPDNIDSVFWKCIKHISNICGSSLCPKISDNPYETLEKYGAIAVGSGSVYLCIIDNHDEQCRYIILETKNGEINYYCENDLSKSIKILEEKISEGYEPLIL